MFLRMFDEHNDCAAHAVLLHLGVADVLLSRWAAIQRNRLALPASAFSSLGALQLTDRNSQTLPSPRLVDLAARVIVEEVASAVQMRF